MAWTFAVAVLLATLAAWVCWVLEGSPTVDEERCVHGALHRGECGGPCRIPPACTGDRALPPPVEHPDRRSSAASTVSLHTS